MVVLALAPVTEESAVLILATASSGLSRVGIALRPMILPEALSVVALEALSEVVLSLALVAPFEVVPIEVLTVWLYTLSVASCLPNFRLLVGAVGMETVQGELPDER